MTMKLVKTATALALGASLISTAVVSTDASAASKYKISKGKLVIAKTGKVAKGYVTYKSLVYKDGKKLTGLKGKTYYKAGKKGTGTYKGAYYYKGAKKITTGTYKGAYYYKGVKKVTTGLYNGRYYKSGVKATGTYKGAYYVKGTKKVTTGVYNNAYYVKGYKKVTTGVYNGAYYVKGVKKVTTGYYAGFHYVAGVKIIDNGFYGKTLYINGKANTGLVLFEEKLFDGSALNKEVALFEEKLFDGAELNKGYKLYKEDLYNNEKLNVGQVEFEGKLYQDAKLSKGLVTFVGEDKKELVYNDGELANGTFTVDGKEVTYKDGVLVPLVVTEVVELTQTGVSVKFPALASDLFDATIVVKNGKGEVVTVVKQTLFKDATSATFKFEKAETAELSGVWTVEGIEVDKDGVFKFNAIKNAADTIALNEALTAADIKNVKAANVATYKTAIADAFKLEEAKQPKVLADIQTIVDKVNADKVEAAGKEALVQAVKEAKADHLLLFTALENGFDRVNKDWISSYAKTVPALFPVEKAEKDLFEEIQTAVDTANDTQFAAITTSEAFNKITDKAELAKIKATIIKFAKVEKDVAGKDVRSAAATTALKAIEDKVKAIDEAAVKAEEATLVKAVKEAKTPTQLKDAVSKLASFVNDAKKLDMTTYVDANGVAYLKESVNATSTVEVQGFINTVNTKATNEAAAAPIKAVAEAAAKVSTTEEQVKFVEALKAAGVKEVSTEKANVAEYVSKANEIKTAAAATDVESAKAALVAIQKIVTDANAKVTEATAKGPFAAIVEAAKTVVTPEDQTKFIASLKAAGVKEVATDKANEAAYVAAASKISAAAETPKAAEALKAVQTEVEKANVTVVVAADEKTVVAALTVIGTKDVTAANAAAYATALKSETTKEEVQKTVTTVNIVANINAATTSSEVKTALDALANNGSIAAYLNISSADRIFIAEQVLVARDAVETKKFADVAAVTTAFEAASTTRDGVIKAVDALTNEKTLVEIVDVLKTADATAFSGNLSNDTAIAEKFIANKKAGHVFKTISEIRTAIAAAK